MYEHFEVFSLSNSGKQSGNFGSLGGNIEKEFSTGSYIKQLKDAWPNLHVVENSKHQKLFVFEGTKFLVPPGAIKDVLEVVDTCHMGYPKAIAYARARYFWTKMPQSIEAHCNSCLICIQHSAAKPAEEVHPSR